MPAPDRPRPIAGAIAMLIVGLMILIPSGLCTGILAGSALFNAVFGGRGNSAVANTFFTAVIFGGPFVAMGGVFVWSAVKRLRERG